MPYSNIYSVCLCHIRTYIGSRSPSQGLVVKSENSMSDKLFMKWYLCFLVVLCAFSARAQSTPKFNCEPSFPLAQGWQGADAAYSIPLDDKRDLWIFGDTLYGDERKVAGEDPRMVRNTVGISTCTDGHWKIDYTIRRGANGNFLDFFPSQHKDAWYWAL